MPRPRITAKGIANQKRCPSCQELRPDDTSGFSLGRNVCRQCRRLASDDIRNKKGGPRSRTMSVLPELHEALIKTSEVASIRMGQHVTLTEVIEELYHYAHVVVETWGIRNSGRFKDKEQVRKFGDPLLTPNDDAILRKVELLTKSIGRKDVDMDDTKVFEGTGAQWVTDTRVE